MKPRRKYRRGKQRKRTPQPIRKPVMAPRSDLLQVLDADQTNLQGSLSWLHQLGILDHYERLFLLFDALFESLKIEHDRVKKNPLIRTTEDGTNVPALDFLLRCFMTISARQQLLFATGHLLRGHIMEIASHIRRAIEGAGIAYLSKSEPDLGDIFYRNDRALLTKRTPKSKILPATDPLTAELNGDVDLVNKLTHNNFESFASRMKHSFTTDEKKWSFDFKIYYHEIDLKEPGHFLRVSLLILRIGELVARLLAASQDLPSTSSWYQKLEAYMMRLNGLSAELDSLVRPESLRPENMHKDEQVERS